MGSLPLNSHINTIQPIAIPIYNYATKELKQEKARFDTRLSKEQKLFFERAARVGGYRSLTDFVVLTVQEKLKKLYLKKSRPLLQKEIVTYFLMQSQIHRKQIKILLMLRMNTKLFYLNGRTDRKLKF